MSNILLTGAAGDVGRALYAALTNDGHSVIGYDSAFGHNVAAPEAWVSEQFDLDILINCAGWNKLNWLDGMTEEEWDRSFDANVKGIAFMSQACLPSLRRNRGTILNIVSSAAQVPMRTSAAYNASKAAALMLTKQMARELAPDITVFSVSPNRLESAMSDRVEAATCALRGWTPEQARAYQASARLLGEELTPIPALVGFISFLLRSKENHRYLAGCDLPYGG